MNLSKRYNCKIWVYFLYLGEAEGSCNYVRGDLGKSVAECVTPYNYVGMVGKDYN